MPNIEQTFGVETTVVKNLTDEEYYTAWFPANTGYGRIIPRRGRVTIEGNIFELVAGIPTLLAKLHTDISNGKIAIAYSGTPTESDYMKTNIFAYQTVGLPDELITSSSTG